MADVAALAGVSQSTVSLVLNAVEDSRIGAATRSRVLRAAEELRYRRGPVLPHDIDQSRVVGMIIDELSANWLGSALIDEIRDICWDAGVDLLVCSTRGQFDVEDVAIRRLLVQNPIGIIYASLFARRVNVPARLSSVTTVLVNCFDGDHAFASVMPDFRAAARLSLEHFYANDHRRIALLNHESWLVFAQQRLEGYKGFLKDVGIRFDRSLVHHLNGAPDEGYEATLRLLQMPSPPTAILCGNDRMAFGAYDAARECSFTIGRDVSIVGYDDHNLAKYLHPALTTVKMPYTEMARWAVEYLLAIHDGETRANTVHRVPGDLVLRESSGPVSDHARRAPEAHPSEVG